MVFAEGSADANRLMRTMVPKGLEPLATNHAKRMIVDSQGNLKEYFKKSSKGASLASMVSDFTDRPSSKKVAGQSSSSSRSAIQSMQLASKVLQHPRRARLSQRHGGSLAAFVSRTATPGHRPFNIMHNNDEFVVSLFGQAPGTTLPLTTLGPTTPLATTAAPLAAAATGAPPPASATTIGPVAVGGNGTLSAQTPEGGNTTESVIFILLGILGIGVVVLLVLAALLRKRQSSDRFAGLQESTPADDAPARRGLPTRSEMAKGGGSDSDTDAQTGKNSGTESKNPVAGRGSRAQGSMVGTGGPEKKSYRDRRLHQSRGGP